MKSRRTSYGIWSIAVLTPLTFAFFGMAFNQISFADQTRQFKISQIDAPEFLTNAQKKSRPCLCQFGYGLRFLGVPLYDITQIQDPKRLGHHSYSVPDRSEKNGTLYSCRNGFMDISHVRAGIDWTLFFAFQIANFLDRSTKQRLILKLEDDRAKLTVVFKRSELTHLVKTDLDLVTLAQRIAYERLTWHEVGSWYTGFPNKLFSEEVSAFSIEDSYSNLLGTYIARRALDNIIRRSFAPNEKMFSSKDVLRRVDFELAVEMKTSHARDEIQTKKAYDSVYGSWWNKKNSFPDLHVLRKRSVHVLEKVIPWTIPKPEGADCQNAKGDDIQVLHVPLQQEFAGNFSRLPYRFKIAPFESNYRSGHSRLPRRFNSANLKKVIGILSKDFRRELGNEFDKP